MEHRYSASRVVAVLGPTNTGKTHLAIDRMLGHASGMIGFPLRLLARENYDRICKLKGAGAVALVTGEERIMPPGARWFVCTVEAMPLDRRVEFLAVDEIQLCTDWERGHVFTDRLLNARGLSETMFLGAETMKPLIQRLIRDIEIITRPRFSSLTYTGPKKLSRLPRRSAIVAFSATDVYALAEQVRRTRGGCAVVLGALSPRARNAQVELYQTGEVDYMVATDAIGMGLNMDLDHVAFARISKFDGQSPRRLTAPEIAQIAGRAGRYMRDGSFGTLPEVGALDTDLIEAIETHRFDPIEAIHWRSTKLDFRTLDGLLRSLDAPPPHSALKRKREAEDHLTLQAMAKLPDVRDATTTSPRLKLLWDVCQIPDFRKSMAEAHVRLLQQIYGHLTARSGKLPDSWVQAQIARLDRSDGEIDQLSTRIAYIRTWTYISHRPEWLQNAGEWQEMTRGIEDRLSDALHEKLTQRFVDRRGAFLIKRLDGNETLLAGVTADGGVVVEGHPVGRLDGFIFSPDEDAVGLAAKQLLTAARRSLSLEITRRAALIATAGDEDFGLTADGTILWHYPVAKPVPLARLAPGPRWGQPGIDLLPSDLLEGEARSRVVDRLTRWVRAHLSDRLGPIQALREAELTGAARGLAFELAEAGGSLARAAVTIAVEKLTKADRSVLGKLGVRLGTETIYLDAVLKPQAIALKALLHSIANGHRPPLPAPAGPAVARDPQCQNDWYERLGFVVLGPRVVRADLVERLAQAVREKAAQGPFVADASLARLAHCNADDLPAVLAALGYRGRLDPATVAGEAGETSGDLRFTRRRRRPQRAPARPTPGVSYPDSPFAKLREMVLIP